MEPVKQLKQKVLNVLQTFEMVYFKMTEESSANSLRVVFDHKTHSSKLKNLNHLLKAQQLKAAWSFCPETWELSVTISQ